MAIFKEDFLPREPQVVVVCFVWLFPPSPPSSHLYKKGEKPKASGFVITPLRSREQHDLNPFLLLRQSKAEAELTQPPDSSGNLSTAKGVGGKKKIHNLIKLPNVFSQAKLGAGFAVGEGGSFSGSFCWGAAHPFGADKCS